jgi:hypothetical protein
MYAAVKQILFYRATLTHSNEFLGTSGYKWVQMGASGYTTVPIGHNYHGFGDGLLVVGESRPSGPSMPLHVKSRPAGEDKMDRGFVGKK